MERYQNDSHRGNAKYLEGGGGPVPVLHFVPQISDGLVWVQTQTFALRGWPSEKWHGCCVWRRCSRRCLDMNIKTLIIQVSCVCLHILLMYQFCGGKTVDLDFYSRPGHRVTCLKFSLVFFRTIVKLRRLKIRSRSPSNQLFYHPHHIVVGTGRIIVKRNTAVNVTVRRFRETIVAVEKQ